MAKKETKTPELEREYIIPLRREWVKARRYKRTSRSVRAIKEFIARHMKVSDRDLGKVKLDVYLNNEVWFRGIKNPPVKIKVRAIKDGTSGDVRVELAEVPESVKFAKARQEKKHTKVEKKAEKKEGPEEKVEEKTETEKKEEKEKAKSVELAQEKAAEKVAKAQKHTVKGKDPQIHRMALKK